MMSRVLDALLTIFRCDRAWLLTPCEPNAATWQTVMERTQTTWPSPFSMQVDLPINPHHAHLFQTILQAGAPVQFAPHSAHEPSAAMMRHFQMQSTLATAIFPQSEHSYALGLHHCARPYVWTREEHWLLQEVGQRLAKAIANLQEVARLRECACRLDEIQRTAHVAYWGRDLYTNSSTLSDEVYRIFGLPLDQRFTRLDEWQEKWTQMIHPDDRERIIQAKNAAKHRGSHYDMEYRIVRPDGEERIVHVHGDAMQNTAGRTHHMIGIVQDVTNLRLMEDELRSSESRFRAVVEHAADAVFLYSWKGTILDVNQQACRNLGYSRQELLQLSPTDFDIELTADRMSQIMAQIHAGHTITLGTHYRRKDDTIFPVEVRARAVGPEDPGVIVALVRDVSERKQSEAALKESEERYRTLFEDNPSMYFTVEADGTVSSVNRFGADHLGYTTTELIGRPVLDVFCADDKVKAHEAIHKCIAHPGELFHWCLRKVCKDGSFMWVEETARATYRADGSIIVLIVCEDISERKRTEQTLLEYHNLLTAIVEGTTDVVLVKDIQGRYVMSNSAGANFFSKSVEEIIGKTDQELLLPETAAVIMANDRKVLASEKSLMFEMRVSSMDGEHTYLSTTSVLRDAQGKVYGVICISRDITELKHLEEQFRQSQKMEAVGRLAGGVAHDFNNLLTVINGYSKLMLRTMQTDERNYKRLVEINKAGERATDLTRQLLAFSRQQILQSRVVNLNELLSELLQLLRPLIGEDIELSLALDNDLGFVKIDPGQFEQGIINLAINARDAMPDGGRLTIATQRVHLSKDDVKRNSG
ncbi:MAG: PAS domain S-box protein, partial [Caldilineaceae bacterium]|nr:PAS domain S-box protein [Caldilineaceae bacterium]